MFKNTLYDDNAKQISLADQQLILILTGFTIDLLLCHNYAKLSKS